MNKVEPNNTERIKQYIDELLTNNTFKSIKEFEEEIYNQVTTINETLECEIPKIEKPNQKNIKDIKEYQQLYYLEIEIIVDKKFKEIETHTKSHDK